MTNDKFFILQRIRTADIALDPPMIIGGVYLSPLKFKGLGGVECYHLDGILPENSGVMERGFYVKNFKLIGQVTKDNKLLKLIKS